MPVEFDPVEILRSLERHGVRFVVIGGLAAVIHGSPYVTTDVDITPQRDPRNLERLATVLDDLDARIRTESVPEGLPFDRSAAFLANVSMLNLTTRAGDLDISLVPAGTRGYEDLRRNAVIVELGGVRTSFASLQDVVRSKEAAGRAKDLLALPTLRRIMEEPHVATADLRADGQVVLTLSYGDQRGSPRIIQCRVEAEGAPDRWRVSQAPPEEPGRIQVRFPADFEPTSSVPIPPGTYRAAWMQGTVDRRGTRIGEQPLAAAWFTITPEGRFVGSAAGGL